MIVSHLDFLDKDGPVLPPALHRALNYLKSTDFSKVQPGKFAIDGDKLHGMLNEYQSEPKEKRRLEAHRKYIDVQYMVSGEETIGYGRLTDDLIVLEDKLAEKDAIFFQEVSNETDIVMTPGMYAIFFPWDVHRPNCAAGSPGAVRKVVLKVAVDSL